MLRVLSIRLTGKGVADAVVEFREKANILAGDSDTGKSYLVHLLDYVFGADKLSKRIDEAEPYSQLFVEFGNTEGESITLERHLSGGNLMLHSGKFSNREEGKSENIAPKRSGTSKAKDVTEVLFKFAGIAEAQLRRDDLGNTNRLTIRTLLPLFLVDEVSMIDERSPVLGRGGYDITPRKRAFVYLLTGKDDEGIIASEKKEIVNAKLTGQLSLISDLLKPIEQRIQSRPSHAADEGIEKVDDAISSLSKSLSDHSSERKELEEQRRTVFASAQRAESQIVAIDELLKQYRLLDERYRTDLERLDFIAEGAHFFDGLQEVRCPLCDQLMSPDHVHKASEQSNAVYSAARAEAAKILAHRQDLGETIETVVHLRETRVGEQTDFQNETRRIDTRIGTILAPALQDGSSRLDRLVARRLQLEAMQNDDTQATNLRQLRERIETVSSGKAGAATQKWEALPSAALLKFCKEVEAVLKEWNWEGEGRVEFDEAVFDIKVDGQARQSHGKGVRAILYAAFVIALLRYCQENNRPHLGTVIIDSPLTSYKKQGKAVSDDERVNAGIEAAFWESLRSVKKGIQIIVIENKEPPPDVALALHYERFAGKEAEPGERVGFIPQ
ncbi:hypothetical protein NKJ95_18810 [Mesorhizobium sp. M0012]|uniref:hypothetical protein n=1 Tax=Mesorhizobium sp. M0012 TaxID=2956840 RepID=UPI003334B625